MFFFQCIAVGVAIGVVAGLCEILYSIWSLVFGKLKKTPKTLNERT